ncbi:hypothetical protein [uncultured Psychroserpens sp.]|uniref:hypothetical protein n=1 Tax=uncultured Psychroserpens sp. TaxID=255436 RepID=UPI00263A37BE|nr:hypothetical protein [uncultured Psychroserpens sp.]
MKESVIKTKKNPIDINDAISYVKLWQQKQPNNCKAFLIPAKDLIDTLEEMLVIKKEADGNYSLNNIEQSGIRAYMAIDPQETDGYGEKLVIVGTSIDCNGVHRDIVQGEKSPGCPNGEVDNLVSVLTGSGAYDLTTPCPNTCDRLSPFIY